MSDKEQKNKGMRREEVYPETLPKRPFLESEWLEALPQASQ